MVRDWPALTRSVRVAVVCAYALLSLPTISLAQAIVDRYVPRPVPWPVALTTKLPTLGLIVLWVIFCRRAQHAARDLPVSAKPLY
jgi:hypothetical protein